MQLHHLTQNICLHINRLFGKKKQSSKKPKTDRQIALEELIGAELGDVSLYTLALTHRSYENRGATHSNERLEYLGDSVVNLAVGDALFELYPNESEGTLTNIRSYLVNRQNMNNMAEKMGLDTLIYADSGITIKGSDLTGNALEALIGAIYLDKGYRFAAQFVRSHLIISKNNVKFVAKKEEDYKTELIILMQKEKLPYRFEHLDTRYDKEQGFIHRCQLHIEMPDGPITTVGVGTTKKRSHQNAAKEALRRLKKIHPEIIQ
ncbi:MAG: ribonuclease III domain-containing protein [Porphyromonas sp.]|nr:ribonuclease III domain-containing protein [Porphyromonas sp.]